MLFAKPHLAPKDSQYSIASIACCRIMAGLHFCRLIDMVWTSISATRDATPYNSFLACEIRASIVFGFGKRHVQRIHAERCRGALFPRRCHVTSGTPRTVEDFLLSGLQNVMNVPFTYSEDVAYPVSSDEVDYTAQYCAHSQCW